MVTELKESTMNTWDKLNKTEINFTGLFRDSVSSLQKRPVMELEAMLSEELQNYIKLFLRSCYVIKKVSNIIEALGRHEDVDSIRVLRDLGTNHESDEIRELTARALIKKNSKESLKWLLKIKAKA